MNLSYLLQRATKESKANGDALVALDHLLIQLFNEKSIKGVLESTGLIKKYVSNVLKEMRAGRKVTSASAEQSYEALDKYGVDLVKAAEEGKLDPVIGRDQEIRRVIQILSR